MAGYLAQAYSVVVVVMASPMVCSAAESNATEPQLDPVFYLGRVLKEEISPRVSRASQLVTPGSAGGPREPTKKHEGPGTGKGERLHKPKAGKACRSPSFGFHTNQRH
jgi:hypothetical protein